MSNNAKETVPTMKWLEQRMVAATDRYHRLLMKSISAGNATISAADEQIVIFRKRPGNVLDIS